MNLIILPRTGMLLIQLLLWTALAGRSAEPWQDALDRMPLQTAVHELNRTNCVQLMLAAFQSNNVLKALIFMPGATDEFYMFRRAKAQLTNASPSLLDAVSALTNQTLIRATIRGAFLLLHTDEDPLEPLILIHHQPTMDKLTQRHFVPHALFNDRDWEFLYPLLRKQLKTDIQPWRYSYDSWHFYRASLAAWNLSGPETLEAIALACKAAVTVRWKQLVFEPDMRFQTSNSQKR